jgi:hypothetical protein
MLEKSTQQLLAAVQVSNQNFTVRVPPDTLWSTELLPGMTVRLNYDIRSINWY